MPRPFSRQLLVATFFVAAYALSTWVFGQNVPQNPPPVQALAAPDSVAMEKLERARIGNQRAAAGANLEAAKVKCYQLFLVNPCLLQARDEHLAQLAQLKRQDNALNDLQRKRRGALQIQRAEERSSPQNQAAQAQRQAEALDRAAQRAQRANAQPEAGRTAGTQAQKKGLRQPLATPSARQAQGSSQPVPGATARKPKPPPQAKSTAPKQAKQAKQAQSPAAFEKRVQDAQRHREEVQKRLQANKKPPSAPLPVPAN